VRPHWRLTPPSLGIRHRLIFAIHLIATRAGEICAKGLKHLSIIGLISAKLLPTTAAPRLLAPPLKPGAAKQPLTMRFQGPFQAQFKPIGLNQLKLNQSI
jgi:hypothetical protein